MKTPSLSKIKSELNELPHPVVMELFARLIKYKKENKELLSYLLFMADDENEYIDNIKLEVDEQFEQVNRRQISISKKVLQKTVRLLAKYAKYSGNKRTEAELFIYFCQKMRDSKVLDSRNTTLQNLYIRQINRIDKAIATLHEDLQYDYAEIVERLKS